MKKILISLLVLPLALSLCACGEAPYGAGRYEAVGYEYKGLRIADSSFSQSATTIVLSGGGRGSISHEGLTGDINWLSGGEYMELTIGGKSYEGRLKNGELTLGLTNDCAVIFRWDQLPAMEEAQEKSEFYGWWEISDSAGEMPVTWIDCFGRIEFNNAQPELIIWDEDGSADKPMARAKLGVKDGVFYNMDGDFWYSELSQGQWVLKPQEKGFKDMIKLSGTALDRSGEEFSYEICLRPWGQDWEDVKEEKPRMLPFNYESWYLPLINEGKALPDKMDLE